MKRLMKKQDLTYKRDMNFDVFSLSFCSYR